MKIKFYLRARAGAATAPLQLVTSLPGQGRLRYSIGQTVTVKFWDTDKQRLNVSRHNPGDSAVNDLLDHYAAKVRELATNARLTGKKLTNAALKDALDLLTGKTMPQPGHLPDGTPTSFYPFAAHYLDHQLARGIITTSSHRTHTSVFNQLQGWRPELTFDGVTLDFHGELLAWLYGAPKFSSASTAGKYVKTVKTIMRAAHERGLTDNDDYRKRGFSKPKSVSDSIYLNPDELAILAALDLNKAPRLDKVRDMFLLGCWTGLRWSDFTRVTAAHRTVIRRPDGRKLAALRVPTQKTGKAVTVPLHPVVQRIWEKYEGKFPAPISNQKFNKYLKELGERAGLTEQLTMKHNRGGKTVTDARRVCDVLTSHTARRSFATNMYNDGQPVASIRAITGHTTDKQFYAYIKSDADTHASIIASSALFDAAGEDEGAALKIAG